MIGEDPAFYTVSDEGMLAYLPGSELGTGNITQLIWLDSSGNEELLDLPAQIYQDPEISPDGRRLSIGIVQPEGTQDIWVHDFSRPGILSRVTRSENAINGIWSLDGEDLIFTDVDSSIWQISASGTGLAERIIEDQVTISARDISPTGEILLDRGWYGNADIRLYQSQDIETPIRPVLTEDFSERAPTISADGRLLAYQSDEAGSQEIYVRPYPQVGTNKWRISVDGGGFPRWDPKGNVLYYVSDNTLFAVEIELEPEFMVGQRREIPLGNYLLNNTPSYAVDPNADRFLFMKRFGDEAARPRRDGSEPALIVLVHNWFEELNRLVPPDPQ